MIKVAKVLYRIAMSVLFVVAYVHLVRREREADSLNEIKV